MVPPQLPRNERHVFSKAHTGPIHVARFNSFGKYILSGGQDRLVKLWNAKTGPSPDGSPIQTYSAHSREVLALDISADNSRFVSGGSDKAVFIWDVATGTVLRRFSAHVGKINDVRFAGLHPDGSVVVAGGFDAAVRFYDLRAHGAWKPVMELKEAKDAIMCISVSGDAVCSGSVDGCVRTYDLREGQLRTDVIDHPVVSLSLSTNNASILASTLDSTHRLLDMSDGSLLQSFAGHGNTAYRCHSSFAASEAVVISGDEGGRLCAWDVLSGKQTPIGAVPLNGGAAHKAHAKAVLWTEESPAQGDVDVLTASADGVLKVWSSQS
ncbi:WD40 repeat-like protein [Tilletiaria anomala UBC 951]|uniref:WD40 repeat-like protein n=1 Tax=Tilletiaria anomala (strain ATCC 24038 / CBS 436.72 / UBC 951) TaxID=1037660 RepID=A0A066W0V4_TILAU|nr:WD40 repeat-like protein [Tilletiaria anomala UBC 951]KDN44704.1 WD40 repeat-like protein [Tilletiaria anomala UBC 951]